MAHAAPGAPPIGSPIAQPGGRSAKLLARRTPPLESHVSRAPLLVLLLLCAIPSFVSGCGPAGGPSSSVSQAKADDGGPASQVGRYMVRAIELRRGPPILYRFDSATGRSWTKGLMEGGGWVPVAEKRGHEPEPGDVPDRYYMKPIAMQRSTPNLIRVATVSGRSWRKGARSEGAWVEIEQPDPDATPPPPAKPVPLELPEPPEPPEELPEPAKPEATPAD